MTLSTLISDRAKKIPDKICLWFGKKRITYLEIDRLITLTAGGLKAMGLKTGERAAILMENCPEYIISYFAIVRSGAVVVPVNTFLSVREVSYILIDSGCKMIIYSANFIEHISELKKYSADTAFFMFNEITQGQTDSHIGDDDEIAVLLYTSGTTGFPKGAMLTHRNLISNAEACTKVMHLSHRDRVLLFLPLFHSFSFTVCVLVPIYSGAAIVLLASVKPFSRVINSIIKKRITLFVAVPTIYSILSKKKMPFLLRLAFKCLVRIRACISGASALPEETIQLFEERFNIPLLEGYGLTEASPVVAVNPVNGTRKIGSVGPPLPGIEAAVIGEDGSRLPSGQVGELIVRGPNVMKGYFNKDSETRDVLKDGWLYTGDMAKIDADGYIFIVDRKKDLIIVDGMNIYPREVEDVIIKHPLIEECAMVGASAGKGSEIPVLFIKKKDNADIGEKEIRDYLKGQIANFKMPR
ncbi:MAG: long-chain fatty acid--CoA ligase, partial [Nitrospirota bacterium]